MPAKKTTRKLAAKKPAPRRPAASKKRPAPRRPAKAAPRRVVYSRKPVATRRQVKAAPRKYARKLAAAARVMTPAAVVAAVQAKAITPAVGASILAAQGSPMYGPAMRSPSYKTPANYGYQNFALEGPAMAPGFSPKALPSVVAYSRHGGPAIPAVKGKTPLSFAQQIAQAAAKRSHSGVGRVIATPFKASTKVMTPHKNETPRSFAMRQLRMSAQAANVKALQGIAAIRMQGLKQSQQNPLAGESIADFARRTGHGSVAHVLQKALSPSKPRAGESIADFAKRTRVPTGLTPKAVNTLLSASKNANNSQAALNAASDVAASLPPSQQVSAIKEVLSVSKPSSAINKPISPKELNTLQKEGPVKDSVEAKIAATSSNKDEADIKEAITASMKPDQQMKALNVLNEIKERSPTKYETFIRFIHNNKGKLYAVGAGAIIAGAILASPDGTIDHITGIVQNQLSSMGPALANATNSVLSAFTTGAAAVGSGAAYVSDTLGISAAYSATTAAVGPYLSSILGYFAKAAPAAAPVSSGWFSGGRRGHRRGRRALRGGRRPMNARRNWY